MMCVNKQHGLKEKKKGKKEKNKKEKKTTKKEDKRGRKGSIWKKGSARTNNDGNMGSERRGRGRAKAHKYSRFAFPLNGQLKTVRGQHHIAQPRPAQIKEGQENRKGRWRLLEIYDTKYHTNNNININIKIVRRNEKTLYNRMIIRTVLSIMQYGTVYRSS